MNNSINGNIEAHGAALYEFNEDNKQGYYIKLKLPNNQIKMVWRIGLNSAIGESKTGVGDFISLTNIGKKENTLHNRWNIVKAPEINSIIDKSPEKENLQPTSVNKSKIITKTVLDKKLEASRLLIIYPKLKELGINIEHISKFR